MTYRFSQNKKGISRYGSGSSMYFGEIYFSFFICFFGPTAENSASDDLK